MKNATTILAIAGCLAGCAHPSPPEGEAEAFVKDNVPRFAELRDFKIRSSHEQGDRWAMEFQAALSPREPLDGALDIQTELRELAWQPKSAAFAPPLVIRPVHNASESIPVTGQLTGSKSGTWQFRDLRWSADLAALGQPRQAFPPEALTWGSQEAAVPIRNCVKEGTFGVLPLHPGQTCSNAILDTISADSVMISHARGINQVAFEDLPPVLVRVLHFDPQAAQASRQQRAVESQQRQQQRERAARFAARQEAQPRATQVAATGPRPGEPSSNVDDIISEHLRRNTSSPSTILVKTSAATFDDLVWAWRVECEYSYEYSRRHSPGGQRVEGKSYAWFRDKLLVRWRDIVPPRSPYQ
jgi:hypothetical protein